jgi:hypothetical protein
MEVAGTESLDFWGPLEPELTRKVEVGCVRQIHVDVASTPDLGCNGVNMVLKKARYSLFASYAALAVLGLSKDTHHTLAAFAAIVFMFNIALWLNGIDDGA